MFLAWDKYIYLIWFDLIFPSLNTKYVPHLYPHLLIFFLFKLRKH